MGGVILAINEDIGSLKARVDALDREMREMRDDIKSILAILNQTKGSWKTLVLIGGLSGAIGAFVSKTIPFTMMIPR